jgi:hypothetical protein
MYKYRTTTRTKLAQEYQVCLKTFNKMLMRIPNSQFQLDKTRKSANPQRGRSYY